MAGEGWAVHEFSGDWTLTVKGARKQDGDTLRELVAPLLSEFARVGAPVRFELSYGTRAVESGGQ